jgi:hypothetical protein
MYEINILPLNYPGLFILFINPTLESIIYYLSKILFKNDLIWGNNIKYYAFPGGYPEGQAPRDLK